MKYQYWLANISGVGTRAIHKMLAQTESAEEIYHLDQNGLAKISGISDRQRAAIAEKKKSWDLEKEYESLLSQGIHFLSYEMDAYPDTLRNISDPPYSLYVKGCMPDFTKRRAAIVGARMCSDYGKAFARKIGYSLGRQGVEVISGLARGIDSYGHEGALEGNGRTFAVLGCGVNCCYPRSAEKLYDRILKQGGILSEYPPDTKPLPCLFPARNRIISALSDMVIVVEAKEKSGSLITADFALEQGKDVYAVPGRITDALSTGCNNLIRQGAGIITSVEELQKDLGFEQPEEFVQENFNKLLLEKDESLVYACLSLRPKSMEELLKETEFEMPKMADVLQKLIQKEFITETFKNYYIRKI